MTIISPTPRYNTKKFTDIYQNASDFVTDYKASGLYLSEMTDSSLTQLFYLLYAQYGNSPIANYDETQFKYKMWSIIYKDGCSWQRRLTLQASIRGLTDAELQQGTKAIYNHALNPSTDPSTGALTELEYINDQNTTNFQKGKVDAYAQVWEILKLDVTSEFIRRFKICFKSFVMPEGPTLYITEGEDDE